MGASYARITALLGSALVLTACTAAPPAPPAAPPPSSARITAPASATTVLGTDDPAALAVATSRALFASAPVAVLAAPRDVSGAVAAAQRLGAPLLVTPQQTPPRTPPGTASGSAIPDAGAAAAVPAPAVPPTAVPTASVAATGVPATAVRAAGGPATAVPAPAATGPTTPDPAGVASELARLGVRATLTVGDDAARWAAASGVPGPVGDAAALPPTVPPPPIPNVLVLAADPVAQAAAVATVRAAGARVEALPSGDPRTAPDPRTSLQPFPGHVIGLGPAFGSPDRLADRLAVAASTPPLPGGGQVLFPGRRMVALYGHPGLPALGVLGEQDVAASVTRVRQLAAQYQPLVPEPVVPAFEIIATIADDSPSPDGNHSAESAPAKLLPWVDAAERAGIYVVLDLQPGRADFLDQARLYEDLLRRPNVGLALDPEWRLGPTQVHRKQIGTVGVDEINRVVAWLADLTKAAKLPQKLLMLHQFRLSMISGRERLDVSRDELAIVIHSDGFGTPDEKMATWNALHGGAPAVHWGWKNFIDEDKPTFTPAQTVPIGPTPPVFVSYQ